jgi:hypothetical protein
MRRILAVLAALTVFSVATPAWAATAATTASAATMTVTIENTPAKIFYNTQFTFKFSYTNTSGGPLTNPHPLVFLYPDPNLPGGHCDPGFKKSMAELSYSTMSISENESEGGANNCHVWYGFALGQPFTALLNGKTRTATNVKVTVRPPNGVTALNLRVSIINPAAPDEPYGTKVISIPVATLPPPPTPITPTTAPPTPTASPTEEPIASDSPVPSPTDTEAVIIEPKAKPPAAQGLGWYWIVAGIALITIGGVLLILLFRWRSQPDELG